MHGKISRRAYRKVFSRLGNAVARRSVEPTKCWGNTGEEEPSWEKKEYTTVTKNRRSK